MSIAYKRRIKNLRRLKRGREVSSAWLLMNDVPKKYLNTFGYVRDPNHDLWVKNDNN